jgi:hypothetical protein
MANILLPSALKAADRSNWPKNYSYSKPVKQFDLIGNLVRGHVRTPF